MIIEELEVDHPECGKTEQFIHDRFDLEYDADFHHCMPCLMHLSTREGQIGRCSRSIFQSINKSEMRWHGGSFHAAFGVGPKVVSNNVV
ncbi:MAG: hypothetical protein BMS9Abin18_0070 [Zetaproteobacteria bacterium]|nr:MAG: hypothetical protein BMS9Abin18_0070 [Zetaproteobacteria bacterium]